MKLDEICGRFDRSGVKVIKEIDSSRGDKDYRKTYLVSYFSGKQLAVKVTNNSFTTPERIEGWSELIEKYNDAGIYAPRIVAGLDGSLFYTEYGHSSQYIVYAEEIKKYRCADEFDPPVKSKEYEEDKYKMIGKIASLPATIYNWNSAYCLYDTFCEDDMTDENYACASEWYRMFREAIPERKETIDEIWDIYMQIRTEFEAEYRDLPKTAFQADLNHTNIMLDNERNFVGVIDFNISGTETILNYALCEACPTPTEESESKIMTEDEYILYQDSVLKERMGFIKQNYCFTHAEKIAYPKLYNMVVPFRWPTFCLFRYILREKKKEYYTNIIDWVYYQITRDDMVL